MLDAVAPFAELLAVGRQAWPDVSLDQAAFAAYVAERVPEGADLAKLHTADLYLACACALGDPRALAAFDRRILYRARVALASFEGRGTVVDEALQTLREKLFLPSGDARPRILEYTGQGSLEGWVKVALTRTALNLVRGKVRERSAEESEEPLSTSHDPELAFIKSEHRGTFSAAFREALGALTPDERNLLRFYLVDKLNIAAIGAIFHIHRATVARWINEVRAKLLETTQQRLVARLGMSRTEVESLVAELKSQLDVSVGWFMRKD